MQRLNLTKKKFVIGLLCSLVILIIAAGFVQYVLPDVLEAKYKDQITNSYSASFPPLDPYLEKMGVALPSVKEVTCDNGPYSPSSPCSKSRATTFIKFDKSSAEKWLKASQQLESYLSTQGWQLETGSKNTTFTKIFNPTSDYQTYATYVKESQGVRCFVFADHLADSPYGSIEIVEGCSKYTRSPSEWL